MRFLLLLPAWVVLAISEPSLVHSCPTHGMPAQHHDVASRDPHAGHSASHSHDSAPSKKHNCTCIGCCTLATGALVPSSHLVVVATVALDEAVVPDAPARVPHRDAHLLLPFANGPPTQRA
jgi:hypothetical protein